MAKAKPTKSRRVDGRRGFLIYLSPEELAKLQKAAKARSMPLSVWIRVLSLEYAGRAL